MVMNIERNVLYWSVPLILWLLQHADKGSSIQIFGKGVNHNQTLVRDKSSAQAKDRGRK
jgi:hypothetical protein